MRDVLVVWDQAPVRSGFLTDQTELAALHASVFVRTMLLKTAGRGVGDGRLGGREEGVPGRPMGGAVGVAPDRLVSAGVKPREENSTR